MKHFLNLFRFRSCLFSGIHFPGNHFPNFPVFVCRQKSWSTENTFRSTENTFQSTKTLSGQRKTLSGQRKFWFSFQESVFPFGCVCFPESGFKCFPVNHFPNFPVFVCHQKSWSTENTFQLKENLAQFPGKCFSRKLTLSESCEKFRNVILFADYIKFGLETFDCYIYFVLNINLFSISSLRI